MSAASGLAAPRTTTLRWAGVGLLLLLMACAPATVPPEVAARRAVDGRDGVRGSGPLAPIGYDLALLHEEYARFLETTGGNPAEGAFNPSDPGLRVANGLVTIDAFAVGDAAALEQDLIGLGLVGAARFGAVVSGHLPIEALPRAAHLSTLRSMRPARMETR